MSDSESSASTFAVPDSHFLRLAVDVLRPLELQSRERGHEALASLIQAAKAKAEASLRLGNNARSDPSAESKLLKLVKAMTK